MGGSAHDRRLRYAALVLDQLQRVLREAGDPPVDSCLLAARALVEAGRRLGLRGALVPVRALARGPAGERGRAVGFGEPVESGAYGAHAICVWDGKLGLDGAAPVLEPGGDHLPGLLVPPLVFPVDHEFLRAGGTVGTRSGWQVRYEPFDDDGRWARVSAPASRDLAGLGALLADGVKRRR